MELLRKYCLGDDPVNFEIVSEQDINFPNGFKRVNYEDPNYNVELPVFSIHGNHDDPSGDGGYAALDLLSVTNLVNYYGKSENIDEITIYPILIRKGTTKLALYGLGNIRDERLYRTFQQKKVKLMRPIEDREEWFSLMTLHQNRVAHSPKNFIHESMLENFLDFVFWGHEHECLIKPQQSTVGEFYISQPGSSVATSLSEGESKKKYVGLLKVCRDQFLLKPLPLTTVRPFLIETVDLSLEEISPTDFDQIFGFLTNKVEEMLSKVEKEFQQPGVKPLLRLKIEYGKHLTISPQRFGQRFVGRVANPDEILLFHRRRPTTTIRKKKGEQQKGEDEAESKQRPQVLDETTMASLISSYLETQQKLELLPESELNQALHSFVDKDEKNALSDFVNRTLEHTQKMLQKEDPDKTSDADSIQKLISSRTSTGAVSPHPDTRSIKRDEDANMNSDSDFDPVSVPASLSSPISSPVRTISSPLRTTPVPTPAPSRSRVRKIDDVFAAKPKATPAKITDLTTGQAATGRGRGKRKVVAPATDSQMKRSRKTAVAAIPSSTPSLNSTSRNQTKVPDRRDATDFSSLDADNDDLIDYSMKMDDSHQVNPTLDINDTTVPSNFSAKKWGVRKSLA
eukprot:TRINITY_DN1671_c0_g1_i1.p1 TRINITY_DN1671_c0_g1~~TRINITY_DN1671_c0_g1_i1.p1  ORF type:complete len:626 (-),score=141.89 TRINITY_DN1671_c0_g1_i1:70-1947(-)